MMGFLDRLNGAFANAGRPDLVGSQQGFLTSLMGNAGQPMDLTPPNPVGQPRTPGSSQGWLDSLHGNVSDNRGMLLGLGSGLLSNGWSGASGAFGGMQYDEQRRAQEAEQERLERQQSAMGSLLEQTGVSPEQSQLFMDAGVGGDILSQALRPAERYRQLSPQEVASMGLPEGGSFQQSPDGRISQIGGGGTNVTVNNGGGTGVGAEEFIKDSVEQATADIDAGNMAARTSLQLDELDRLLQAAPQGMEGGLVGIANGLGIAVDGADEVAAAQAILNQMAPQLRPPGSGPMSDADLRLFQASLPRIINQPGGNQIIMQGLRALNAYDQARGQIAAQYQQSVVSGMPEAQALQAYHQQIAELNASTPSLQSIVGTSEARMPAGDRPMADLSDQQLVDIINGR